MIHGGFYCCHMPFFRAKDAVDFKGIIYIKRNISLSIDCLKCEPFSIRHVVRDNIE